MLLTAATVSVKSGREVDRSKASTTAQNERRCPSKLRFSVSIEKDQGGHIPSYQHGVSDSTLASLLKNPLINANIHANVPSLTQVSYTTDLVGSLLCKCRSHLATCGS